MEHCTSWSACSGDCSYLGREGGREGWRGRRKRGKEGGRVGGRREGKDGKKGGEEGRDGKGGEGGREMSSPSSTTVKEVLIRGGGTPLVEVWKTAEPRCSWSSFMTATWGEGRDGKREGRSGNMEGGGRREGGRREEGGGREGGGRREERG